MTTTTTATCARSRPRVSRRALAGTIVRNAFGRAEDEITKDFQIPLDEPPPLQGSAVHPVRGEPVATAWRPLTDDELGATPEAEPLLDSLRRAPTVRDHRARHRARPGVRG